MADNIPDFPILKSKYPAKAHCTKVASYLQAEAKDGGAPTALYVQGQVTRMIEDCDQAAPFRQRRHFMYLTGCLQPDCHLVYDCKKETLTLFIPPLDPDDVMWSGLPLSTDEAKAKYEVDECFTSKELESHLTSLGKDHAKAGILAMTDRCELPFPVSKAFSSSNNTLLHPAIDTARVTKDAYEVALLRKANAITAEAHNAVIKAIPKAGCETHLQAEFLATCLTYGAKKQGYDGIFGSGTNAATLHYLNNDETLGDGRRNVLVDAGCEWDAYTADVTRTLPLNPWGFDKESLQIYVIVEQMQSACFKMLRAGMVWEELHVLAHEIAIQGLLSIGLLKGGTVAEILQARTSVAFFPHGLGHYLGMDTHDPGGKPNYSDPDPMFRYLRIRGSVPHGAVVTVEPGIYFCRFIVEPYLKNEKHSRFIDSEVLNRYWDVGGVRIEDDVYITDDGFENLTTAPKRVEDITKLMNT